VRGVRGPPHRRVNPPVAVHHAMEKTAVGETHPNLRQFLTSARQRVKLSVSSVDIEEHYEKRQLNLVNSYIKNKMDLAKFANNNAFLTRCSVMQVVPPKYRLSCDHIRNTRQVIRLIDRFSILCMEADMRYNKLRRNQINQVIEKKEQLLNELLKEEDAVKVKDVVNEAYEAKFLRVREQQMKAFEDLLKEYEISPREKELKEEEEGGHEDDAKNQEDPGHKTDKDETAVGDREKDDAKKEEKTEEETEVVGKDEPEEETVKTDEAHEKRKGKKSRQNTEEKARQHQQQEQRREMVAQEEKQPQSQQQQKANQQKGATTSKATKDESEAQPEDEAIGSDVDDQ